ncbi:MAG TPA: queuosine precursor transporter [Thermoanaerobaculia bacterium]|nr:queuosine precursor transporter [Thermoanaerobaculia bacterium]
MNTSLFSPPRVRQRASASVVEVRRERVFLVLAGLFLGSMTMLNIFGVTRFLDLSFEAFGRTIPMPLAVGVLPYPLTFLCTDFISELYGKARANLLVWVGLLVNVWLAVILWLGGALPGFDQPVAGPDGRLPLFFEIRMLTLGSVTASMLAYLAAQLCDVHLFHFWRRLTKGRHLWLRNNGSTLVSQLVDTFAVITITHFWAGAIPVDRELAIWPQLWVFIGTGYVFKVAAALVDTIPFYLGTAWLSRYLAIDPNAEHP